MEFQPFLIGDLVIAIKDHSHGDFIKDQKATITGVKKSQCKCGKWLVCISPAQKKQSSKCKHCDQISSEGTWYAAKLFRRYNEQKIKHVTFSKEVIPCLN